MFQTQREKLLAAYEGESQDYVLSTTPYHSVKTLEFEVVDADTTEGVAFAVCRANQQLDFFDYGVGDRINQGADTNHKADESDTNLGRGKSTNGASDFVIEGFAINCRGARIDCTGWSPTSGEVADADVVRAINGEALIKDPAAIVSPPQVDSPYNLENNLFQAVLPILSLTLQFDRNTIKPLGVCSVLPEGGGQSYLRSNGVPSPDHVYAIEEGYIWRRDGQGDSEFVAKVRTEQPVVVPISLVTDPHTDVQTPTKLYLDILMRAFGIEVEAPSQN